MGQAEVFDQLLVGAGLVEGGEIRRVEVLDERLLEAPRSSDGPDQGRDRRQAGALGGAPPPFPGDELVVVADTANEDGLQDTDSRWRRSATEGFFVELFRGWLGLGRILSRALREDHRRDDAGPDKSG